MSNFAESFHRRQLATILHTTIHRPVQIVETIFSSSSLKSHCAIHSYDSTGEKASSVRFTVDLRRMLLHCNARGYGIIFLSTSINPECMYVLGLFFLLLSNRWIARLRMSQRSQLMCCCCSKTARINYASSVASIMPMIIYNHAEAVTCADVQHLISDFDSFSDETKF